MLDIRPPVDSTQAIIGLMKYTDTTILMKSARNVTHAMIYLRWWKEIGTKSV
jgi:hypothetical protein